MSVQADEIPVNIVAVCCADERFAMPMAVMMTSAVARLGQATFIDWYVIDGGMTQASRKRVDKVVSRLPKCRLHWRRAPDAERFAHSKAGHAPFLRLLIDNVLPAAVERIIYLDSDMIVLGDLSRLWAIPLNDSVIAAVQDFGVETLSQGLPGRSQDDGSPYFNSGVMLIDLVRWRNGDVSNLVMRYTRRWWSDIRFADQDGLNAVLAGKWVAIADEWNVQVGALNALPEQSRSPRAQQLYEKRSTLLSAGMILHFVSGHKPWHAGRYRPVRKLFIKAMHRSHWFNPAGLTRFHVLWFAKTCRLAIFGR